jgi:hypothetical protein
VRPLLHNLISAADEKFLEMVEGSLAPEIIQNAAEAKVSE